MSFDFENTFNAEEYLYFYRDILSHERSKKEIDFLVKYAELSQSLDILDLACGHGRHSNALAQLGHKVTGVDITDGFLKVAKEDAARLGVQVNYIHQDMRELNYKHAFDRVFVLFTALGYFDDEQNEMVFRNIYNALRPKGIFCFDSHNRDTFLTYFLPCIVAERDGDFMIDQNRFDTLSGRAVTKRSVIYKKTTKSFEFGVRFYNPTDILKLFKHIGFSSVEFYENWDGKPLSQEAKRMIVVAKK